MFNFAEAQEKMAAGLKVKRISWHGIGMWLTQINPKDPDKLPYYELRADGKFVPWVASHTDLLTEDWEIVE